MPPQHADEPSFLAEKNSHDVETDNKLENTSVNHINNKSKY
jgi:hypothetical protein